MTVETSPTFHWVKGENSPVRDLLWEGFRSKCKDLSLMVSENWPEACPSDSEKPSFWVFSSGDDPPRWAIEGDVPIIQFHWTRYPSDVVIENSAGLITPYIPKPMSFTGLVSLFKDTLQLWASPYLYQIQTYNRNRRVVIIEDEESQQFLMQEALKEVGLRSKALFFENGSTALDELKEMALEEREPLILFLDLMLPGMGGDEVLKAMKASSSLRKIPVALLTGAQSSDELDFLREIPRHFCFKLPLLESDAIDMIRRCLTFFRHAKPIPQS